MRLVLSMMAAMALISCSDSSGGNVTVKGSGGALAAKVLAANTDPSSLTLTVYKFAVSESGLCTDPVTVFENAAGVAVDFLDLPEIGSGTLDDGTYPCIIFEFSDNISFVPSVDDGQCTGGEEASIDVCADHGGDPTTGVLADGTAFTCDDTEQRVAMYISTFSSSSGGGEGSNAFNPPTSDGDTSNGINLGAPFTVAGSAIATFVVDATGAIEKTGDDDPARCDMAPPSFSFTDE